jgi:hypothetical protein
MNRIIIPLVIVLVVAATLFFTWNIYFYFFDSQVRVGTIVMTVVLSVFTGWLIGFFMGLNQGRRGRNASIKP